METPIKPSANPVQPTMKRKGDLIIIVIIVVVAIAVGFYYYTVSVAPRREVLKQQTYEDSLIVHGIVLDEDNKMNSSLIIKIPDEKQVVITADKNTEVYSWSPTIEDTKVIRKFADIKPGHEITVKSDQPIGDRTSAYAKSILIF